MKVVVMMVIGDMVMIIRLLGMLHGYDDDDGDGDGDGDGDDGGPIFPALRQGFLTIIMMTMTMIVSSQTT